MQVEQTEAHKSKRKQTKAKGSKQKRKGAQGKIFVFPELPLKETVQVAFESKGKFQNNVAEAKLRPDSQVGAVGIQVGIVTDLKSHCSYRGHLRR